MRVSQNEIYRAAQRALEGAGAAYGIDRDGAQSVAWLEGRGLPGLAMLARTLDCMAGAFAPLAIERCQGGGAALDLAGRPSIAWAGAAMDCLALVLQEDACRHGEAAALTLRRCRWPLLLVPQAMLQARRSRPVELRWRAGAADITVAAAGEDGCRIVVVGAVPGVEAAFLDEAPTEVVAGRAGGTARAVDRGAAAQVLDEGALDAALRRSLAEGVSVDDEIWARIDAAARKVLVPSSDQSRDRGAGGGDANS